MDTTISAVATTTRKSTTLLHMAPQFDGEKWVATSDAELPTAGYGMGKTLLLQGPKPFLTRLLQPDDYEQAVLKFMATDQCDRSTAQGNMDAYLRNPQDWMYNRMEEEKRGIKIDYTRISPKEILLVLVWSSIVVAVVGRGVYSVSAGESFVSALEFVLEMRMAQFVWRRWLMRMWCCVPG